MSVFDCVVLAVGLLGVVAWRTLDEPRLLVVSYVTGTFFLYCNVFRIRRTPELMWAGVFTVLASCSSLIGQPTWYFTIGAAITLSVLLIGLEMFHPSYHGILWRKVNPKLEKGWKEHHADQ